jgi:uncharacterized protein YqfA (UPF0365 family)
MNTDIIILITILIIFFGLLLFSVYYLPRLIIKLRAKANGLIIDLNQASIIQKCYCVNKEFFRNTKAIWELEPVSIEQLATHVLASGNLRNIREGILELKKQNLEVDFSILSALDLTNIDIRTEVLKSKEIHSINIENIRNNNLNIHYKITFRESFPNLVWSGKSDESKKKAIETKLDTFLNCWHESDPIKTEHFIRENILSIEYLEKEIGSIIESQEYKINNWR